MYLLHGTSTFRVVCARHPPCMLLPPTRGGGGATVVVAMMAVNRGGGGGDGRGCHCRRRGWVLVMVATRGSSSNKVPRHALARGECLLLLLFAWPRSVLSLAVL